MPADIVNIPVSPTATQAWTGVRGSTDTILVWNSDITNTVYVGFNTNVSVGGGNAIAVPPNGSFNLPASRNVFVVGSVKGVAPLVVIPDATGMFRSLTQGLGALAVPSVFSPGFIAGVIGWIIRQDGSAEFNNLTIRGTFFGFDFILNQDGMFFYSGPPGPGNLVQSITINEGTDQFGNVHGAGFFTIGGGFNQVQIASGEINFYHGETPLPLGQQGQIASLGTPGELVFTSGTTGIADVPASMVLQSKNNTGIGNSATLIGPVYAVNPNVLGTPDDWKDMSAGLLNGWTVTAGQDARFRLMEDNSVWLDADLTAGVLAGGTNVWTAGNGASGYAPATAVARRIPVTLVASTAAAQAVDVYFTMGAHLQVHNMVANMTRVMINARYPIT